MFNAVRLRSMRMLARPLNHFTKEHGNFVRDLLRYQLLNLTSLQVFDLSKYSSWVFSGDLAQATNRLVGANLRGLFYVTGETFQGLIPTRFWP